MSLKTLDEIDWIQKDVDGTIIATDTKALRQEAIKWILEDMKELIRTQDEIKYIPKGTRFLDFPEIKRWMKRFNLKEDDLKNGEDNNEQT